MSQLRHSYPQFRARHAELLEVGPGLPANAARAFRQYLGDRELEFPYLCDPGWSVHAQYGLRELGPGEKLRELPALALSQVTRRPFVAPHPVETARLATRAMQQGLFLVDEEGVVRHTYVTSPSGQLPPPSSLLELLDGRRPEAPAGEGLPSSA